jgi:branched-chain amino acid transport system substrate-binding protein
MQERGTKLRWAAAALTMTTALSLVGAAAGGMSALAAARHARPRRVTNRGVLKIGILAPLTGTAAALGADMVNGWDLYWQLHGDKVDGYTIQTIVLDTAGNPTQALTQARKLVADGIAMEVGPFLANEGQAVAPYLESQHIPFFYPASSANTLTEPNTDPYFLRLAGWTSSQPSFAAGEWACKTAHDTTAVTIAPDYSFGWESVGGFAQVYTDEGCKILAQLWPPLGTSNFSPYLSQIERLHPQMVFAEMVGSDAGHFLEQWASFGLKNKIPLVGHDDLTGQADIHGVPGKDLYGIITFRHYTSARNDPLNRQFDLVYAKRYGELPAYVAAAYYTAAQWISAGIEKVHGNLSNKLAFVRALKSITLKDSLMGPMRLDSQGNPIEDIYMTKLEPPPAPFNKYSAAWNAVLKVYPNQSQFGPFNPQEFMAQPPYTTSFQGIGYTKTKVVH